MSGWEMVDLTMGDVNFCNKLSDHTDISTGTKVDLLLIKKKKSSERLVCKTDFDFI